MSKEISPEILKAFEQPIEDALIGYEKQSEGYLVFDLEKAKDLELTPEERYSAKSESEIEITIKGQDPKISEAKLVTALFMPRDDTGAGYGISFDGKDVVNSLPRPKDNVHSEAHLTIASFKPKHHLQPVLFSGNLAVMTLIPSSPERIERGFDVGQERGEFVASMHQLDDSQPKATLIVGENKRGNRFGDPHAVFNGWQDVIQVAGFIAVKEDEKEIIEALKATEPRGYAIAA